MRISRRLTSSVAGLSLLAALACADATAPTNPAEAAGTYVLESVSGRGPASGFVVLSADGSAERRVRYANVANEDAYVGSFEITGPDIVLTLHPAGVPASYVWELRGRWNGARFSIHYPDPADGPDIVETFKR